MEEDWSTSYNLIISKHDEAYQTIEKAIKNEEQEDPQLALINYKLGIVLIDEALSTPVAIPEDTNAIDETWNHACQLIHKMKRTRGEVVQRIGTLSLKYPNSTTPPTDSSPISTNSLNTDGTDSSKRPRTFTELAEALRNLEMENGQPSTSTANAKLELIFSCEGAKLYHIKSNGEVSTQLEASVLQIVCMDGDDDKNLQTTFFLHIILHPDATSTAEPGTSNGTLRQQLDNSWIYPLIPGVAPCFLTSYGAFIFPDLQSEEHGTAYGITVPSELVEVFLELLEAILHGVVKQPKEDEEEEHVRSRTRRATSQIVSQNIVKGAHYISQGLIRGSTKVGELVTAGTPYILSKLGRAPSDTPPVSTNVINSVEIAKSATGAAASVTGYVAGKVGSATMALGRFLAPHVQAQGSKLLSSTMGYQEAEATEKMSDVLTIAAGAVEGFGTVYSGLEQSASVLGRSLSDNSVKIIEHKYGQSAGNVAAGTFDTVGNLIYFSQNVNYMTPKGLAKKTAKNAGKAMVEGYKPRSSGK